MTRRQSGSIPPRPRAFTLLEILIAMAMTAILLAATLSGLIGLQKSYAATEQYATGMADQMRLLDYLALDLRRALPPSLSTPAWAMDPDGQGLQINVPDYYQFGASDPQHLYPIAVDPTYDPSTGVAFYSSTSQTSATPLPHQVIAYRFVNGLVTRADPWQPLIADGHGGFASPGPLTITSIAMDAFPTITADPIDASGHTVHYNITFHSSFQPLEGSDSTNQVTLHNVTFIRNKNPAP